MEGIRAKGLSSATLSYKPSTALHEPPVKLANGRGAPRLPIHSSSLTATHLSSSTPIGDPLHQPSSPTPIGDLQFTPVRISMPP